MKNSYKSQKVITFLTFATALYVLNSFSALADDDQFERGRSAIGSMTGCYLIDYSYTETESLKEGYIRDSRVYDVNKNKSIKEWIYAEEVSANHIRLQHVLFGTDLNGNLMQGSELRHQAEDWIYNAEFLYDFAAPQTWVVKDLRSNPGLWTRKITNLDDGLRYQCAAAWNLNTAHPEWSCDNFAPIPGRETRDMQRKDYNTLDRSTRVVAYGHSWLERQANTKIIYNQGMREPLAKELGKNWYVRLPDSDCDAAQKFIEPQKSFYSVLREAWAEILDGNSGFTEKTIKDQPTRFAKILEVQERFTDRDLNESLHRSQAKLEIQKIIATYRAE